MAEVNQTFLRRLEEMWDKDKLHKFVSENIAWMDEEPFSPDEIKASFLSTFHEELLHIANAIAGPFNEYRRIIERSANPILFVRPIKQEDVCMPGRIMKLPEECEVEWHNKQEQFEKMLNFPEHEELMKEMARITQEIYDETKTTPGCDV